MGPFPPSKGYTHILVAVDYVTKLGEFPARCCGNSEENSSKYIQNEIFH
jgi:hypothetical protein